MSDASRPFPRRSLERKAFVPNATTIAAMERARRREGMETVTLEDLKLVGWLKRSFEPSV